MADLFLKKGNGRRSLSTESKDRVLYVANIPLKNKSKLTFQIDKVKGIHLNKPNSKKSKEKKKKKILVLMSKWNIFVR